MNPTLSAILLMTASAGPPLTSLRFFIDERRSDVTASVAFLGLSRATIRFPRLSGAILIDDTATSAITLNVSLDARSVVAADTTLTHHLRGTAFFDVDHHPFVRFQGRRLQRTGTATGLVTGDLTVRGITRPAILKIAFSRPIPEIGTGHPIDIDGVTTIDRRDFGMTAYRMIVGRDVTIRIRARMASA